MKNYKLLDTSAILSLVYEANFPQALKIITDLGYNILIPKEVYKEIKDVSLVAELLKDNRIDLLSILDQDKIDALKIRHPSFHDGEISVLICGEEIACKGDKCRCIIDEKDAKTYANINNLRVNGVIGLFLWLKRINKLNKDDCMSIHKGLIKNPRLPRELLNDLLK